MTWTKTGRLGGSCETAPFDQPWPLHFLQQHRLLDQPARFDVLVAELARGSESNRSIQHYRNAFEAVGRFQMYQ